MKKYYKKHLNFGGKSQTYSLLILLSLLAQNPLPCSSVKYKNNVGKCSRPPAHKSAKKKLRHLPFPLSSHTDNHETCGSRITYCDNIQLCRVKGTSWAHAVTVATIWYNKLSTVALLLLKRVSKLHMTPRGKHISYVTGTYCKYIVVLSRR